VGGDRDHTTSGVVGGARKDRPRNDI
jgi:hypothetical protein